MVNVGFLLNIKGAITYSSHFLRQYSISFFCHLYQLRIFYLTGDKFVFVFYIFTVFKKNNKNCHSFQLSSFVDLENFSFFFLHLSVSLKLKQFNFSQLMITNNSKALDYNTTPTFSQFFLLLSRCFHFSFFFHISLFCSFLVFQKQL